MIPKEITLNNYVFQNQYYITGHYDFQIKVEYEEGKSEEISRRYSDIRNLYKTLILKCPGCLIPNIPSKSIWLKINYGNKEQMMDRMEGIKEFLTHLVKHKILRKNKYVKIFFSKDYQGNANSSKSNNSSINKDDSDDDFDFDSNLKNNSDDDEDKKENDKNKSDDEDIEPSQEFIEEYNNKKKGIVSKGKKLIGNMFNYVMSYASSSNNNEDEEEKENNKNNNEVSNIFYKKLNKEDYDFINQKSKELGEDFEINEYNEKINRLNEGVKNIIQNLEKISIIRNKNIHALENIVNNDNNYRNLNKENKSIKINKDSNIDTYDDNDNDDDENCESNKINNHKNNISKIRQHCVIQRGFLSKKEPNITKIKKYQSLLDGLLDIYSRKKEHINYLGRLHSQKEEMEKLKENKGVMESKIDELKNKLKNEIKFINKINKDLKYEIERYKENQEDIYILINSLFKDKSNSIKSSTENLNKNNCDDFEVNVEKSNLKKVKTKESNDEKNEDDF